MSDNRQNMNNSPLRARLEQRRREQLAQEQRQLRDQPAPAAPKPPTGPLTPPQRIGTGPLRALPKRSPYAAAQIIDWFLPRTRRLNVLLTDPTLLLSDIPGFDPSLFEISFGRVNAIVNDLEEQYKIRDQADHPRLVDAANTVLNDKIVAARLLLEMFGHLKHSQVDNYQIWQLWENTHRNSATVIMHNYLRAFEDSFQARYEDERQRAQAEAVAAFLTYAAPTSFFGSQHPRYLAIRRILNKAVQQGQISEAKVDKPPDPDEI